MAHLEATGRDGYACRRSAPTGTATGSDPCPAYDAGHKAGAVRVAGQRRDAANGAESGPEESGALGVALTMPWYLIRRLSAAVLGGLALVALCGSPALAATKKKPKTKATRRFIAARTRTVSRTSARASRPCASVATSRCSTTRAGWSRIDSQRSLAARAAQQEGGRAESAAEAAAQRDRTLLATYLTVADIERLRDQRLEILVQQIGGYASSTSPTCASARPG